VRVPLRLPLLLASLSLGVAACGPQVEEGSASALEAANQAARNGEGTHSQEDGSDAESPAVGEAGQAPSCTSSKKVLICHVPPGNPANAHWLCVGRPAEHAHLAHGDHADACEGTTDPGPGGEPTDAGSGEEPGPTCRPAGVECAVDADCCGGNSCIEGFCSPVID
jgi:hypothetical protein